MEKTFESGYETFSQEQRELLAPFVSDCDEHIFVLKNLPEVIKGALFSRYSRSYLGLRSLLLKEFIQASDSGFNAIAHDSGHIQEEAIQKAQAFYDRILDGYGDDSIGELGGAHLAVENVSMLAAKQIEDCRIGGSPLEKSTRYICFDRKIHDKYLYLREPTLMQSKWAKLYESTCDHLFETYSSMIEPLTEHIQKNFPKDAKIAENAYQAALRAKVLDCLRGLLPASALTNLGVFGNGRFFEKLLIDLSLNGLAELQSISRNAHKQLSKVIPSFVRRATPHNRHWSATESYSKELKGLLKKETLSSQKDPNVVQFQGDHRADVKLLYSDPKAVENVLQALSFEYGGLGLDEGSSLSPSIFKEIAALRNNRRHKSPRALERAFYSFEIIGDFGAYRDLQRHRMLTQERQRLGCTLGYTVPEEIDEAGLGECYRAALELAADAWAQIAPTHREEAQYIVPMAYRIRWYYHINLRALQWLCELRSTPAGHPEYRFIAQEMARLVSEANPAFAPLLGFVDYEGHRLGRMGQEQRRHGAS